MATWNVMHIFGYGESQMIGSDKNGKVESSTLSTIAPLMSYLATKQQPGTDISLSTLYSLNIYNSKFVDFLPKDTAANKRQRFAYADLDDSYINNFATELAGALP